MKSFLKLFALAALVALCIPGLASAATASEGSAIRFEADAAAWICSCCPKTCGGGTLFGCYNTTTMPPNAVTCTYKTAGGREFECVSCMAAAATEQEAFLQRLSGGADSR